MINSSGTIGNQTRDVPVCSAVPQPNALPRFLTGLKLNMVIHMVWESWFFLYKDNLRIIINNKFITILFAGDISILFTNSNFIYNNNNICTIFESLSKWFKNNLLSLNLKKKKTYLFSVDRAFRYNFCKLPTWCTILFRLHLFQFSTCFEHPCAHQQENQLYLYDIWYMSLWKISEWTKIRKSYTLKWVVDIYRWC